MAGVLQAEYETYLARKPELLRQAEGKVVLIHGTAVHGIFDEENEALAAAYALFGLNEAFFIRRVEEREPAASFGIYST